MQSLLYSFLCYAKQYGAEKDDIPGQAVLATDNKRVHSHIKTKLFQRNFESWLGGKKTKSESDLSQANSKCSSRNQFGLIVTFLVHPREIETK